MTLSKIKTIVFPVGGLGTRFLPATKAMPKEMLPVVDKPLIQYAYEEAVEAGIERFVFITGRNKNVINNHFDHSYELQKVLDDKEKRQELALTRDWVPPPGQVAFIRQQEPLGLGHAIWCARHFIHDEPFAVILADELLLARPGGLAQMVAAHARTGGSLVGVREIPREQTGSYGIVSVADDDGATARITAMIEKPKPAEAPSTLAITGPYILSPAILPLLGEGQKGASGEIQLTDAMNRLLANESFHAVRLQGERFDCGSKLGFLEANIAFALARADMRDGVRALLAKYAR